MRPIAPPIGSVGAAPANVGKRPVDVFLAAARNTDVPADDRWLSPEERTVFQGLAVEKRRRDWRLGRWTVRQAVARALTAAGAGPPRGLAVVAASDGAPEVRLSGDAPALAVSISHSREQGFAVAAIGGLALGCDVERIEPRSDAFIADYLTAAERELVGRAGDRGPEARALMATLVWSGKESALKALRQGLRSDTRTVEVSAPAVLRPPGPGWHPLSVTRDGDRFPGFWRSEEGSIWTVVARAPIRLR